MVKQLSQTVNSVYVCVRLLFLVVTFSLLVFPSSSFGYTDSTSTFDDFLRFVELENKRGKVETSIITYTNTKGTSVDLIGVVHIGEKDYYQALEDHFEKMDALLYEMVKPKNSNPEELRKSKSRVSSLQRFLKNTLRLEFQLDVIDYNKKNFIHADMTPTSFSKAQEKQGESLLGLLFESAMGQQAAMTPGDAVRENLRFLAALTNRNRNHALKMFLGRQLGEMEKAVLGFGNGDKTGEDSGTVLLEGRNKVAIKTLRRTIRRNNFKRIGIFYGAAHMPDMEKRLLKMGFKKQRTQWLVAWDMTQAE